MSSGGMFSGSSGGGIVGMLNNRCGVKHRAITVGEVRGFNSRRLFFKLKENKANLRMIRNYGFSCGKSDVAWMIVVTGVNIDRIFEEIGRRMVDGVMKSGLVDGR